MPIMSNSVRSAALAAILLACCAGANAQWKSLVESCARGAYAALQRIEVCTKALAEEGQPPEARASVLNNRGFAYHSQGDDEHAMADYDEAIVLDPGLADAWNNRGALEGGTGDLEAALRDFDAALKIDPTLAKAHLNRALARQALGEADGALQDFEAALKGGGTDGTTPDPRAYRGRAELREARGDVAGAIEDMDQAIKLDPANAAFFVVRGRLWGKRGDITRAIADDDEAIRLDPNSAGAYNNRCTIFMLRERYKEALADCNAALKIDSSLAAAHFNKGVLVGIGGDNAAALDEYSKAIEHDPRFAPAYKNRGTLRFDAGQFEGALSDLDQAAQLMGADPYVALWRYLARRRVAGLAGRDDPQAAADLQPVAERLDGATWPAPVLAMMLGKAEPAAVFDAAQKGDARQSSDRMCEASFYVGEWRLLQGEKGPALRLLSDAERDCRTTFAESAGARSELERASR